MGHGAPGEPGTLEGYGAQSTELAQLRKQQADLLGALKEIADPKFTIRHGSKSGPEAKRVADAAIKAASA